MRKFTLRQVRPQPGSSMFWMLVPSRPNLRKLVEDYDKDEEFRGTARCLITRACMGVTRRKEKKSSSNERKCNVCGVTPSKVKVAIWARAWTDLGRGRPGNTSWNLLYFPNNKIAAGFETAVITLKDGRVLSGQVRKELDSVLEVFSLEEGSTKVNKAEIIKREHGLSAMPEGLAAALTKRDLRDLVEYLAGLK